MQITKLTITKDELNLAVEGFLKTRGIDVKVNNVDRTYGPSKEFYEVDLDLKDREEIQPPPPAIKSVEELGTAIEKGEF